MSDKPPFPTRVISLNTAAFALAFAAWVMFGPSVRTIAAELSIDESWATWIKALPILTGSIFRAPIGILTDRLGARTVFSGLMFLGAAAVAGLSFATSATALILGGFLMGMVGTTFVVGVQSVSTWTPADRQGLAMGCFGVGNAGTAITTLAMPLLLAQFDWRTAFQIYAVVLALGGVGYAALMPKAPEVASTRKISDLVAPLADPKTWALGLFYMATFGVFVTGSLSFGDIYIDVYGVSMQTAGVLATSFALTAAFARAPGGGLSDRFGARGILRGSLIATAVMMAPVVFLPLPLWATVTCFFLAAIAMGFGMSATLKYIPEFFPTNVGAVGGMVGTLGGLAGFFLPLAGAQVHALTGEVVWQVLPMFALLVISLGVLAMMRPVVKSPVVAVGGA